MIDTNDNVTPDPDEHSEDVPKPPRFRISVAIGLTVFTSVAVAGIGALNHAAVATENAVANATRVIANDNGRSSAADQYGSGKLVALCRDGSTLRVREATVPALLASGAERGSCSTR